MLKVTANISVRLNVHEIISLGQAFKFQLSAIKKKDKILPYAIKWLKKS